MKKTALLMIAALATSPLMGQSAKEVADNLSVPNLAPGAAQLPLPAVPEGVSIELGGADYEQIIGKDGSISPVISEVPVQVFFKVTKDGQTANSKDYEVMVKPEAPAAAGSNAKPATIPAILQWKGGKGVWTPGKEVAVRCAQERLRQMLAKDLESLLPDTKVRFVESPEDKADVELALNKDGKDKESYRMQVSPEGVQLSADTQTGLYYGTRTLLQILASKGAVPCGTAVDIPRYALRGFMLDIARTHYALNDLYNVVDLMAWFKMNDLHLVINNNYIFHEHYVDAGRDPFKESYSAFRLESKVKGADGTPLTAQDLFYTKKDFRALIDYAKERGVNIVPEFDTPGHALSFTRVRPDLIYKGEMRRHPKRRCEMLDAANPETLKFVGEVFDEYLLPQDGQPAVFDGCVMHVGSDEFFGEAEDYRKYTDGLLSHVLSRGYTPRVWGSLSAKPGKTPVTAKGVQMNLWSTGWMKASEALNLGFDVINTNDGGLYIVPFAGYYRMDKNHVGVYNDWLPNRVGGELLPAGHPQLLGATFAVWNDMTDLLHNGYGMFDIWKIISETTDVLSQRMWGLATNPRNFRQHRRLAKTIGRAPGSNPLYVNEIAESWSMEHGAHVLNKPAVGPAYHLSMLVQLAEATPGEEQALLSGPEGMFGLMKDGSIGFRRADGMEFSWDAKLPEGKEVKVELIGVTGKTHLLIDGKEVQKLTLNNYNNASEGFGKRTRDIVSTFVLPLQTVGESFRGSIRKIELERHAESEPSDL